MDCDASLNYYFINSSVMLLLDFLQYIVTEFDLTEEKEEKTVK